LKRLLLFHMAAPKQQAGFQSEVDVPFFLFLS
jgi:hypothetical protein